MVSATVKARRSLHRRRKHNCCIKIIRERDKRRGNERLALFIKERKVKTFPSRVALLACLHENQGYIVPYQQLGIILGYKTMQDRHRHTLRQHMLWIKRTLTAYKALCILAVAPNVGYVLCGHQ
jgi:hypothetical protein